MEARTVEILFTIISFFTFLLILATPLLIIRKLKNKNYFLLVFISLILTFILFTFLVYWSEELSKELIYKLYGFDTYKMGMEDPWTKVISNKSKETIMRIYNGSFGIGWPLKVILSYIFYLIPYNLISCGIIAVIQNRKK